MKPESSKLPLPPLVDAWVAEQPSADRRALEESWRLAEYGRPSLTLSDARRKMEVWATVSKMTRRMDREEMPRPRHRHAASRSWRRLAAAAVVALLVGLGYMLRPISVHAPHGQLVHVTLPDGSDVQLNSGSMLTYRAHFIGRRVVRLEGEAFFDVVEDDNSFVVETFNATTTVLGTEFNVRARPTETTPSTSVVVASGRVKVASSQSRDSGVVLHPGQRTLVLLSGEPALPTAAVLDRELAWRHGGLSFTDEPFSVIFDEIERRFNVEITASNEIRDEAFSIYLHNPSSIETVLADLAQAEGLRYRATASGYEVYRP